MEERQEEEPQYAHDMHHDILSSVLGRKKEATSSLLYSYKHGFSGFAVVIKESQAEHIAGVPGVAHVVPNHIMSLHTTRSWDFLQLNLSPFDGILSKSRSGDGSIISLLDTGIWPESESFGDKGMGEIPTRWRGMCQGEEFNTSNCNRFRMRKILKYWLSHAINLE